MPTGWRGFLGAARCTHTKIHERQRPSPDALTFVYVEFYRDDEARVTGWHAVRGQRTRIPGTVMALGRGDISHDLAQYIVEAATGTEDGFWGLLAKGATFRSIGRKRTPQGRSLIAAHRDTLRAAEQLAATHIADWRAGGSTPVTNALQEAALLFSALEAGERIRYDWPSTTGHLEKAG